MIYTVEMVNKEFSLQIVNSDKDEFTVRILNKNNNIVERMVMTKLQLKNMRDVISNSLLCDCNKNCCCDLQEYIPFNSQQSPAIVVTNENTSVEIPVATATV